MPSIRTRLEKLESLLQPKAEESVWAGIGKYLTLEEILYFYETYEAGGSLPPEELARLWLLGFERRESGMQPHDIQKLYGEEQRIVEDRFWRFLRALADKIGQANVPSPDRFNTLALREADVDQLIDLARSAVPQPLEAFAHVIGRLKYDHRPMAVADFARLFCARDLEPAT